MTEEAREAPTAALVVIGDEILSGKVEDTNSRFLVRVLREAGVDLARMLFVADVVDEIAWAVRICLDRFDHVFTSGGIGPTHDDMTPLGVATALGVPVVRHPELEAILREHFGERLSDGHLKMADVPEGSDLLRGGHIRWPIVQPRPGLYMLPGVPQIFEAKVEALGARLEGARAICRWVFTRLDEALLAPHLEAVLEVHPRVRIGSYPILGREDYRVKVAIESRDAGAVDAAIDALLALVPDASADSPG